MPMCVLLLWLLLLSVSSRGVVLGELGVMVMRLWDVRSLVLVRPHVRVL